ncbi:MAG: aspartyl/asparaginyl beta-hydroxylase domain-containing protein, partial [Sphingomonas sp.]
MALNGAGMQALSRGDFAAAADLFARAAAADPAAPPLWINLATARRGAGDDEGERAALHKVLEIDQRHLMANIRLAELHERLHEAGQAAFRWNAVLAMAGQMPDRPPTLEQLLAHARDYVAKQGKAFGETIDAGLAEARSAVPPSDRRRFDACVDVMLGRRRVYHNECHGLHFPFLPADEFFDRRHFPWMPQIEAQTDTIRAEFEALATASLEGFEPYVAMDAGVPDNKWSALDHSLDWSAFFLWRFGERIEEACARCPETAAAMA